MRPRSPFKERHTRSTLPRDKRPTIPARPTAPANLWVSLTCPITMDHSRGRRLPCVRRRSMIPVRTSTRQRRRTRGAITATTTRRIIFGISSRQTSLSAAAFQSGGSKSARRRKARKGKRKEGTYHDQQRALAVSSLPSFACLAPLREGIVRRRMRAPTTSSQRHGEPAWPSRRGRSHNRQALHDCVVGGVMRNQRSIQS